MNSSSRSPICGSTAPLAIRRMPKIASGMMAAATSVSVSRVWKERLTGPGLCSGGGVMPQSSSMAVAAAADTGRVAINR
jgi:hypothetical protein